MNEHIKNYLDYFIDLQVSPDIQKGDTLEHLVKKYEKPGC
jgi:hypothetical protein